jgi:nucleoside triphosphate pyrophosphatase
MINADGMTWDNAFIQTFMFDLIIALVRLILASASPRRAELLRAAGYAFDVLVPRVDETPRDGETAQNYVRRLAIEKSAAAIGELAAGRNDDADTIVIAADTSVVVDGDIVGKPRDDVESAAMLRRLSGRWHEVMTGVSLRSGLRESGAVEITRVEFSELGDTDLRWYVTSGEGRDKAGAYAIQGLASRFIPRIDGSYSNVVGLPIALVRELLKPFETR